METPPFLLRSPLFCTFVALSSVKGGLFAFVPRFADPRLFSGNSWGTPAAEGAQRGCSLTVEQVVFWIRFVGTVVTYVGNLNLPFLVLPFFFLFLH